ncbi:MAG: NAD(P)H-hydrate dehydratase, partial [Burkholderiales bacterium]|nr:NAD(P)H-hydrate dehydratase [Opitutaceae bacterium]
MHGAFPILTCEEAKAFEAAHFAGDEAREWAAMQAAGRAVARGIVRDFAEIGGWPERARVLVLAGKGHNAGDACIAATALCLRFPDTRVEVVLACGERALRPLALRAWRDLAPHAGRIEPAAITGGDVVIDGVFGFQFRPPLPPETAMLLAKVNASTFRLRAAVDLPSGLDAPDAFRADFTYATGIVKTPLLTLENAGRVRFLDLGFPLECNPIGYIGLGAGVLNSVRALRPARSDKRTFGHVLIVAGSRRCPGAALMATLAALRGGAGLVTTAVPESLVPAFAAQVPEAMWIGLPETPDGGLALEGLGLVREAFARATAVVLGPGLG